MAFHYHINWLSRDFFPSTLWQGGIKSSFKELGFTPKKVISEWGNSPRYWRKIRICKNKKETSIWKLVGGFKVFYWCSSIFGEDFQFDYYYISNGLKPPTRYEHDCFMMLFLLCYFWLVQQVWRGQTVATQNASQANHLMVFFRIVQSLATCANQKSAVHFVVTRWAATIVLNGVIWMFPKIVVPPNHPF